jgi:hypothetical protein
MAPKSLKSPTYRSALVRPKPSALPPWMTNPQDTWLSVSQFAQVMKRSRRTIEQWLRNGTLRDFNIAVYRDPGRRVWIKFNE